MIKRFSVAICLLVSFISFSQEGTSSPYSFYGVGEMRFKGSVESRSMASIAAISDTIHFNLQNPAFLPSLKFTTFTIGGSYMTTTMKTESEEENARRTAMEYLAVAFPMGKFGAGFGLAPFSSVGYKILIPATDENNNEARRYTGTGGLNKVFFSGGYQITKNLAFGAEFNYIFGDIETASTYSLTGIQYGSRESNESNVSGVGFIAGLAYKTKFGEKLQFFSSATFSPHTTLSFSNTRRIAVIQFLASGGVNVVEEDGAPVADTKVANPAKFTFGAGIGENKKWMLAAELTTTHNSSMDNRLADIDGATFENAIRIGVGGYYIPNANSFSSYISRMTYRAGFRFENTGLIINNEPINESAVTAGLGFPITGSFSNINLGVEYGKRGTTKAGLIQENYLNFTVGLSFNDRWFVKRKYD